VLRGAAIVRPAVTADHRHDLFFLFLAAVTPTATAAGVRLAIHPDDPPFPVLGLPRIVSTEADLAAILALVDTPANGLCYCTGSLGARLDNDLPGIARRLGPRIHAVHLRSVQHTADGVFYEANHLEGSMDMPAVVRALLTEQAARRTAARADWQLTLRPDHGHTMLDDLAKPPPACPGYSLIGRPRAGCARAAPRRRHSPRCAKPPTPPARPGLHETPPGANDPEHPRPR
jgi:mannonate dehydratase